MLKIPLLLENRQNLLQKKTKTGKHNQFNESETNIALKKHLPIKKKLHIYDKKKEKHKNSEC